MSQKNWRLTSIRYGLCGLRAEVIAQQQPFHEAAANTGQYRLLILWRLGPEMAFPELPAATIFLVGQPRNRLIQAAHEPVQILEVATLGGNQRLRLLVLKGQKIGVTEITMEQ